jgi:hypothetical protein
VLRRLVFLSLPAGVNGRIKEGVRVLLEDRLF